MYRKRRFQLVLWVIVAILTGVLPTENMAGGKVAETLGSAGKDLVGDRHELKSPAIDDRGYTIWDCVYFGKYWQEDTNGDGNIDRRDSKTPIKWRVLSVDGDDAYLLADQNLEMRRFSLYSTDITWEISTLRSWLNGYGAEQNTGGEDYCGRGFLNEAFSQTEQQAIRSTTVINEDNPSYGTEGGNDTSDKIYVLSFAEVMDPAYGFSTESTIAANKCRMAENTDFAIAQGAHTNEADTYEGNGSWWLRTTGYEGGLIASVTMEGRADLHGRYATDDSRTVRPVLHLNLAAESGWAWAGRVNSIGKVIEKADPPAGWQPTQSPMESQMPSASPDNSADDSANYGLKAPTIDSDGITTWDCLWFGEYWGEDDWNRDNKVDRNDSKSKIRWRVLSVHGSDAFLIADKVLDCQRYNAEYQDVTWETCTLRSWLNGYGAEANTQGKDYHSQGFLNDAFTEKEQQAIRTTTVVNEDNYLFGTEGGNDTKDKVYLLSYAEVTNPAYGFPVEDTYDDRFVQGCRPARMAEYMPFVRSLEAWTGDFVHFTLDGGKKKYAQWWLRSPGAYRHCAICVDVLGHMMGSNFTSPGWTMAVHSKNVMIRPVLHLDLSVCSASDATPLWTYAGTVCSSGEENIIFPWVKGREPAKTPGDKPAAAAYTASPNGEDREDMMPAGRKPGRVLRVKLEQKKHMLTVTWGRVSRADGYQICYSTSPSWKRKKQKKVLKNRVTLKKLKPKKIYYVRVRAYSINGTNIVYGKWSRKGKIKMKK